MYAPLSLAYSSSKLLTFLPSRSVYDARSDPHSPNNIVNLSGDEHSNRRRVWNRGFSTESLREYEDMIARRAEQLIEKIGAIDGPVDR